MKYNFVFGLNKFKTFIFISEILNMVKYFKLTNLLLSLGVNTLDKHFYS